MKNSSGIIIAPSLLSADFARLGEEIRAVEAAGADWLHVDVMDGHFVPNLTIGPPVVKALRKVASKPLDVHVMIEHPEDWAERYIAAGAATLTFHAEAARRPDQAIDAIVKAGARPAMALSPDTSLEPLLPFLDRLAMILVMSVYPGFGGQKFMPEVLPKIRELRERGYQRDVQIDGGIDLETIDAAARAGANVFVSGTGVFSAPDWGARILELRQRAEASFPHG